MRLVIVFAAACGSSEPPPAAPTPPAIPRDAAAAPQTGCVVLPQPSKPGHSTVEPDDMICMHGDTAYSCPPTFDAASLGCRKTTTGGANGWAHDAWCCPAHACLASACGDR
jgi:hypothetical protein